MIKSVLAHVEMVDISICIYLATYIPWRSYGSNDKIYSQEVKPWVNNVFGFSDCACNWGDSRSWKRLYFGTCWKSTWTEARFVEYLIVNSLHFLFNAINVTKIMQAKKRNDHKTAKQLVYASFESMNVNQLNAKVLRFKVIPSRDMLPVTTL